MRKKLIFIIVNIVSISSLLHGMKLELPTGSGTSINPVNNDLQLDFGPTQLSASFGNNSSRTPIKEVSQMSELIKARSLIRSNTHNSESKTTRNGPTSSDIENKMALLTPQIPNIVISQFNEQPNVQLSGLQELFIEEKQPSFENEWAQLEITNPGLYAFAREFKMSFDNVLEYAKLSNDWHIEPECMAGYVNDKNQLNNKTSKDLAIEHYEDLRKNNPEKYTALELRIIKELLDKDDGQENFTTVHNEHLVVQEKAIDNKNSVILKTRIVTVLSFLLNVLALTWGTVNTILPKVLAGNNTAVV